LIGLVAMLATLAALLAGIFDHGPRRVFPAGFAITVLLYAILIWSAGKTNGELKELNLDWATLPTSRLLQSLHKSFAHYVSVRTNSNEVVPDTEATQLMNTWSTSGVGPPPITSQLLPLGEFFMPIGHYWWALL